MLKLGRGFTAYITTLVFAALVLAGQVAVAGDAPAEQPPAPPPNSVAELARRFGVPADKSLQMQLIIALADKDGPIGDLKQAIDSTMTALEHSNAEDDLTAPPTPTGDALFDRYALAVDERINRFTADDVDDLKYLAALSDADLAAWEPDFGADPRYWELRYLCAKCGRPGAELAAGFTRPSDFLDEAQRRGIATANTLLLRYAELRQAQAAELEPYAPPVKKERINFEGFDLGESEVTNWDALNTALPVEQDPQTQAAVAIMARQEREQLELLNAIIEQFPSSGWAFYARAFYWFELGEQEPGLEDLAAGNKAAENVMPDVWPVSFARQAPQLPAPPGNAAVCGAILLLDTTQLPMSERSYLPSSFEDCTNAMRDSFTCINLNRDLSALEQWHQLACRMGQSNTDNYLYPLGRDLSVMVYMENQQTELLDPAQLDVLHRFRGAYYQFQQAIRSTTPEFDVTYCITLIPFAGIRGVFIGSYIGQCDEWRWQQPGRPQELFADLSQIHFPELTLPDCLRKYEPLTQTEIRFRYDLQSNRSSLARAITGAIDAVQSGGESE